MRSIVLCLGAVFSLIACEGTRAVTGIDKQTLAAHEAQWGQRSFHSYRFDYSESRLSTSYNVRITVVDDTIASVIDTTTGSPPPVPRTWPTMNDLFGEADFFANNGSYTVSFEYDERYGYLTLLSAQPGNPGGGLLVRVTNLQPLE